MRVTTSAALAGAVIAATLGGTARPAMAAYTANVEAGNGNTADRGDSVSDELDRRLQPGVPTTLQVDVGADGSADFSSDRGTLAAIEVNAGAGDDAIRIDQSAGAFPDNLPAPPVAFTLGDGHLSAAPGDTAPHRRRDHGAEPARRAP